jgi:hypothetical protein
MITLIGIREQTAKGVALVDVIHFTQSINRTEQLLETGTQSTKLKEA